MPEYKGLKMPAKASVEDMRRIHIEPVPDDQKVEKAIQYLDEMRKKFRSFVLAMESCVKCGLCAENCHTYLGTRDPNNIPTNRAELIRKIYRRYFTLEGRWFGKLVGAEDLNLDIIEQWYSYFYQCNECRRCAHVCPFGIDTCEVTMIGRQILHWLGIVPKLHADVGAAMERTGNHTGLTKPAIVDTLEFLSEEIKDEFGVDVEFPVDKEGADIMYVPSSADFLLNPYTLMGAGMFFTYIGANWTIPSTITEAGNFGLLFDQQHTMRHNFTRLLHAAQKLGVKKIVWGECGHGWRAWKMYLPGMADLPIRWPITHIHDEVAYYIRTNQLKLDPNKIGRPVTLHDPCNYVRACGMAETLRTVIRACVADFREMYPNKENNFCCGGGSAILFDDPEMYQLRIKFSQKKAEQVRATGVGRDGNGILCAPCSICKAQLYPMVEEHQLGVEVKGLIDLVGLALVWK
ncbi:sulfate reduction electron transfer complex DsrMKJOP subunit DsrK [Desulfofundulus thermocisternus]|uniref:sulfate reduction electron transfer complex DsrMKJOP subunit DsrK n=1 Tax=Desulfofundulus thermocisternus TaxID=42471 RepID=UPI001A019391|nr:(Fe-S)-binding protein [Desulfofundulus thermocisternus]MBE3586773.1 (Fe-S)-binding protein [Thermoanaerobacter sp.]MCS5697006.1 (Fe-S)-binding protein [Desulfofundulus thermocisternus]